MVIISDNKGYLYYECVKNLPLGFARIVNYTPTVVNYVPRVTLQIVASLRIKYVDSAVPLLMKCLLLYSLPFPTIADNKIDTFQLEYVSGRNK